MRNWGTEVKQVAQGPKASKWHFSLASKVHALNHNCISYLLLHKNINPKLKKVNILLSYTVCGSGIWEWLPWVVLVPGWRDCGECQPGLQSSNGSMGLEDVLPTWRAHRDGRSVLPWWEVAVPCHLLSPWTAGVFLRCGSGFPQSQWSKRVRRKLLWFLRTNLSFPQ